MKVVIKDQIVSLVSTVCGSTARNQHHANLVSNINFINDGVHYFQGDLHVVVCMEVCIN